MHKMISLLPRYLHAGCCLFVCFICLCDLFVVLVCVLNGIVISYVDAYWNATIEEQCTHDVQRQLLKRRHCTAYNALQRGREKQQGAMCSFLVRSPSLDSTLTT